MNMFPPEIAITLDSQIVSTEYDLEILVCGVDDEGSHIYRIFDPGVSECFDSLGFNAIGTGAIHAVSNFISHEYTSNISLEKALYITLEGKIISENAPGVGELTDIAIIDEDGIKYLTTEDIKKLEDIVSKDISKLEDPKYVEIKELINNFYPKKKVV